MGIEALLPKAPVKGFNFVIIDRRAWSGKIELFCMASWIISDVSLFSAYIFLNFEIIKASMEPYLLCHL